MASMPFFSKNFAIAVAFAFVAGSAFAGDATETAPEENSAMSIDVSASGVERANTTFDPMVILDPADAPASLADDHAPETASGNAPVSSPATAATPTLPEKQRAFLFDYALAGFSQNDYANAVAALFSSYEKTTGRALVPGAKKKVALKIYTHSGKGLCTPFALTRAVRDELVKRGFSRENILLVDLSEKSLRKTGYLPPFRRGDDSWEGSPVAALDTGKFYDAKWFFENPLPSRETFLPNATGWDAQENDRKSFLPVPLLFDVDFWINLPVATDSAALGVSGALANATLWNVSNQRRFLDNPANAAVMAVNVAAIPEFRATFELTLLSLEKYQFIGGQKFAAAYTASEKRLWLSANPVVLDYLLWQRMNALRVKRGFDPILPEPPVFAMAGKTAAALGSCVSSEITLVELPEK